MFPRRVCLRLSDGRLLPATAVGRAGPGTAWVPVPVSHEGRVLALYDEGRPTGTHPAIWYGWPRTHTDTRDEYRVSNGNETREVRAYDVDHAIAVSGFERAAVRSVLLKEGWY